MQGDRVTPYPDFSAAVEATLARLSGRIRMQTWMMTRREGEDWIILGSTNADSDAQDDRLLVWSDSICSRMVDGGPSIVPDVQQVPDYASAPIVEKLNIGSYIGLPICNGDGELFGTLCAIDPEVRGEDLRAHADFIQHEARLLATILQMDRKAMQLQGELEILVSRKLMDPVTGLFNRAVFEKLLEGEDARSLRFADPVGFLLVRLLVDPEDSAGTSSAKRAIVETIKRCSDGSDLSGEWEPNQVASLLRGGRENLMMDCVCKIQDDLHGQHLLVTTGFAARHGQEPMQKLIERACEMSADLG